MPTSVQPIVLVGGRSRRFGRDKLRASMRDYGSTQFMVDQPIAALRDVFGANVAVVGDCHEAVACRADAVIDDKYPGIGPIGGIVSALEATGGDVFVLAGDLPWITSDVIRRVLDMAESKFGAMAVLARSDRLEPCIGLYRRAVLPLLQHRISTDRRSLHDALPAEHVVTVNVDGAAVTNVNAPSDLRGAQTGGVT